MWVRKTIEDIASERRKLWLAFGGPLIFALLMFVACIIRAFIGPFRPQENLPSSFWGLLVRTSEFSLIVAILAYLCQVLFGKTIFSLFESKVQICDSCYHMKSPDGQQSCNCGGKFEDFRLWKWVDD
jgi:hypothetical protein